MVHQELVITLPTLVYLDHDNGAAQWMLCPQNTEHKMGVSTGADGLLTRGPFAKETDLAVTRDRLTTEGSIRHVPKALSDLWRAEDR